MSYLPMSRPDRFDPLRPGDAPISVGAAEDRELKDGLSLAELATALSAHGGGVLSADLALDLVLNEIVEHARLATGATAAAIALVRGDEIVCRATTGANAPDLGVRLDVNSGLSGACVQSKIWQHCDDSEIDSRVDPEVCRGLGVRSILIFPVVREDELLGVFEIFSPRPNAFCDREIQTLQALSRSIVSNFDRAADVLALPATVFPFFPTATTEATVAEVENVDRLQVDRLLVERAHPDIPVAVPDSLPETTKRSEIHPRSHWMSVLTLTVIALALFLGWMVGYVGRQKASIGTKAREAVNAAALPGAAKMPDGTESLRMNPGPIRVSAQPTPTGPTIAPAALQRTGTETPLGGGLVVYENGKIIFRTPPQASRHSSTDAPRQPVMVPSKVADEYLMQRVEPEYPEQAREQHIQGPVVLEALVGKDGAIEKLSMISGDAQLAAAASDAVRQWRFKPFFRNGSPEDFQTQITVSFRLP
jgi:TonB family protein